MKKTVKTARYISSSIMLFSVDPRLSLARILPGIDCVNDLVVFWLAVMVILRPLAKH
ncbi:hypothetical protein [Klebsiella aerogenes]|uniref:hypothetical protein n=1 Tax=Klebsiella aerogenes TaxID=548 RepID=UPI001865DC46|nr:hypothetical protein [Klebsiella aerogenes]EKU4512333.1 hypothetical protein [Klebsiella aerogenes]WPS38941.1 hypothetical protein SM910_04555 [Klebsiella aerogenes]HBQ7841678.1 hypothetical protein [Klebsiella aerogenes]HBS5699945.1 hypothetical protein [Klebsiella aerogenes]HBY1514794.1 hypothetical protein [Klebsiella aerogenes]